MRKCGVLLPIFSIPSHYGIGSFSRQAYEFVDFLEQAGQKLWQILPLGPTSYGDSPYQSFSTFAGNPYYIDLETLVADGYLEREECDEADFGNRKDSIDYARLYRSRFAVLKKAYQRALEKGIEQRPEYREFLSKNAYWLEDYALYMAVKSHFQGNGWELWEKGIRLREKESLEQYAASQKEEIGFFRFLQYLFSAQWKALKAYANGKGIEIIGDIPIYVAFDSADTWANPRLFLLDEECRPTGVAGCPPDAFSATGQLWGNPLYDWGYHRKTGYEWWRKRITYCYELYDIVRIDHFRGFDAFWFVPFGDQTAENGHWEKGPGYELFAALKQQLGKQKVIAEDLGFLTASVLRLVKKTGFPSMKVLQFAFGADARSPYLPHNYERNCVVYTGTHDNDTTIGWFGGLKPHEKRFLRQYLNRKSRKEIPWELIRTALASTADTAVIPMQDYLGLGREARINTPSTLGENWKWRMDPKALTKQLAEKMHDLAQLYGRV